MTTKQISADELLSVMDFACEMAEYDEADRALSQLLRYSPVPKSLARVYGAVCNHLVQCLVSEANKHQQLPSQPQP